MMPGPELTREDHVESLHFEATETGSRRSYRATTVVDHQRQVEATYDAAAARILISERNLTAFRTGLDPIASERLRFSLTLDEARALNDRLSRLLAEAQSGAA